MIINCLNKNSHNGCEVYNVCKRKIYDNSNTKAKRKEIEVCNYELSNMWNVAPSLEVKFQGNKPMKEARHNLKNKYLIKRRKKMWERKQKRDIS